MGTATSKPRTLYIRDTDGAEYPIYPDNLPTVGNPLRVGGGLFGFWWATDGTPKVETAGRELRWHQRGPILYALFRDVPLFPDTHRSNDPFAVTIPLKDEIQRIHVLHELAPTAPKILGPS